MWSVYFARDSWSRARLTKNTLVDGGFAAGTVLLSTCWSSRVGALLCLKQYRGVLLPPNIHGNKLDILSGLSQLCSFEFLVFSLLSF